MCVCDAITPPRLCHEPTVTSVGQSTVIIRLFETQAYIYAIVVYYFTELPRAPKKAMLRQPALRHNMLHFCFACFIGARVIFSPSRAYTLFLTPPATRLALACHARAVSYAARRTHSQRNTPRYHFGYAVIVSR